MSNNDNVMARFLFAILQQKCLKDIDWNKVAHDPILAQPITNGHAARMRYSRFKAAMLGTEPQRRNRTNPSNSKSRVSKNKKGDSPMPKKEEEEKSSGSGIGNIKTEKPTGTTSTTIKSERSDAQQPQPPASMTGPATTMKTEPGLVHPYSQHQRHPSIFSTASPRIKQERLPTTAANTIANTTPPMPEPRPFGLVTTMPTTTASASSVPYLDSQHRMQMRFPTPCSDSDGVPSMNGFLPLSPVPSTADLLHQHSQHHQLVGAGSPPLSTTASTSSPYDFTHCDSSPTPWHSQPHPQQHHQHHHSVVHALGHAHHSQPAIYSASPSSASASAFGLGLNLDLGGDNNSSSNNIHHIMNTFCGEHHHYHHQGHGFDEEGHLELDTLGLNVGGASAGAGAGGGMSLFRERELEMEMATAAAAVTGQQRVGGGGGDGNAAGGQVKAEWEEGLRFEI
ncbi:hypothetical protein N657DRAFT_683288 [Parathielavia appendiculata]|uniref:Myb-like DNA-binding domain-containing protein n=1 Tax=Parathielavia appendiculata TaxID=2587402 RepID=A0AAN6Z0D9_9PEZI|nr:hypothetical protein N657DRAFT_683288 [Parathielavia appendiculata]